MRSRGKANIGMRKKKISRNREKARASARAFWVLDKKRSAFPFSFQNGIFMNGAVLALDEHSLDEGRLVPHTAFLRDAHALKIAVHDFCRDPMQHELMEAKAHDTAQRFWRESFSPEIRINDISDLRRIVFQIKAGKAAGADHFSALLFHEREIVEALLSVLSLDVIQVFF